MSTKSASIHVSLPPSPRATPCSGASSLTSSAGVSFSSRDRSPKRAAHRNASTAAYVLRLRTPPRLNLSVAARGLSVSQAPPSRRAAVSPGDEHRLVRQEASSRHCRSQASPLRILDRSYRHHGHAKDGLIGRTLWAASCWASAMTRNALADRAAGEMCARISHATPLLAGDVGCAVATNTPVRGLHHEGRVPEAHVEVLSSAGLIEFE